MAIHLCIIFIMAIKRIFLSVSSILALLMPIRCKINGHYVVLMVPDYAFLIIMAIHSRIPLNGQYFVLLSL